MHACIRAECVHMHLAGFANPRACIVPPDTKSGTGAHCGWNIWDGICGEAPASGYAGGLMTTRTFYFVLFFEPAMRSDRFVLSCS
mmetsp:Transcript_1521/g.2857  ORF Transcript_1521/g.2857 Transcript_1521/m.2857 type:complete len:85 (+) Transcript_1521:3-257(+)